MSISLRPEHLKRYKELAMLLAKYARSDLLSQLSADQTLRREERPAASTDPKAEQLPVDLERLGPTFVKLGQFLSTRSDILPPQYLAALSRLQDNLEPFPFEIVESIIASELGLPIPTLFASFHEIPVAAASLAQVHLAQLHDGRIVAVKVQRPSIRERIVTDLDAFEDVVDLVDRHTTTGARYMLGETLNEFRKAILRELDFRLEAQNLNILGRNLKDYPHIIVPAPIEEYSTSRVLLMDYVHGTKVTELSPERRLQIDGSGLARELFRAYLQQILVDGFYHADPHPGNVILTDEGKIALLDLGMVAKLSDDLQRKLLRLLLAISEGRSREAVEYAIELGEKRPWFNAQAFGRSIKELVIRYQRVTIQEIEVGRVVLEVFKIAAQSGFRFPRELAMLGKSLLNLDHIGRALDPTFDPNEAIRDFSSEMLWLKIRKAFTVAGLYEMILDSQEFIQKLPKRTNKIMGALAADEFVVHVDAIDEKYLMTGLQKIANRLTFGLILAAMILGSAMMIRVDTPFKIFGYPGLAMIFLGAAMIGVVILGLRIFFYDERLGRKDRDPSI